ncbi:hypothetical protein HPB47_012177 [Ixodes persulcatus]|uniref:Uncharacterized protein n=1 Tax=Ixodes persulcatus TaxID=34615 RepID=A0AC60NU64_IXOPE|nr:hypothetical protein HPB47_012177 [Ixodes persulcatus]
MTTPSTSTTLKRIRTVNAVLCVLGILISCYAYRVETRKEHDRSYQAMCDINQHMSCSKVFTSRYGRGFGLLGHIVGSDSVYNQPNSVFGVLFYLSVLVFGALDGRTLAKLHLVLSVISNIGSVYLACILYFVLHDFCVVCVTMYVINALLLTCSVLRLKHDSAPLAKAKRS